MTRPQPDEQAPTLRIRHSTFVSAHAGTESRPDVMSGRFSIESRHRRGEDRSPTVADDYRHGAEGRSLSGPAGAVRPLVEAELAIPSLRHGVVDRARIRRALDRGDDAALTLVAAPAGYGKTTAVRAWCASMDVALAWVTLDASDNDAVLLWRYVATAVDRVRSGLGRAALRRLGVAGGPGEVAIDELMNGVGGLGSELVVVLDDLQAVTSEESLSSIDHALGHLPPNLHMVLLTRVDPALRLQTSRTRTVSDLRFRASSRSGRGERMRRTSLA